MVCSTPAATAIRCNIDLMTSVRYLALNCLAAAAVLLAQTGADDKDKDKKKEEQQKKSSAFSVIRSTSSSMVCTTPPATPIRFNISLMTIVRYLALNCLAAAAVLLAQTGAAARQFSARY